MRDQCPNADDRVIDVLGKLLAKFRSNLVVGLSVVTVSGCEAFQVRYGFNVPNKLRGACQAFDVYRSIGRFLYAAEAVRSDIEKFYALESNLSESPRSRVPYFRYLLALHRSQQQGESPCE
jgi:hypothetical protein